MKMGMRVFSVLGNVLILTLGVALTSVAPPDSSTPAPTELQIFPQGVALQTAPLALPEADPFNVEPQGGVQDQSAPEPAAASTTSNSRRQPAPQVWSVAKSAFEKPLQEEASWPWVEEGMLIALERKSPQAVALGGKMQFVATLVNRTDSKLHVIAEVIVLKGDGSQETLIPSYPVQLGRGKEFRVSFAMAAKAPRFAPGVTQFIAFLRDAQGDLVDRASITFMITLPIH